VAPIARRRGIPSNAPYGSAPSWGYPGPDRYRRRAGHGRCAARRAGGRRGGTDRRRAAGADFSGHTVRATVPIEAAALVPCVDDGVALSRIAGELARLPGDGRVIVICDSCYAAAIACTLTGSQPVLVLRAVARTIPWSIAGQSEFVVRLEQFVASHPGRGTLAELREALGGRHARLRAAGGLDQRRGSLAVAGSPRRSRRTLRTSACSPGDRG